MKPIRIKQSKNGQYYFEIVASNGVVIALSTTYQTKAACENGIRTVKRIFDETN